MKIKINVKLFPLYILLLVGCLRWFFEGVIGGYSWQIILLSIALIILVSANKIEINHMNFEWFFFLGGILLSMILGSGSMSNIRRFTLFTLIVLFAIFCNYKPEQFRNCIKFIITAALIYSVFIVLQYVTAGRFNSTFFSILQDSSRVLAESYYNRGYVPGIFFTPANPAGLIMFTISFLILESVMHYNLSNPALVSRDISSQPRLKKPNNWILIIALIIPLLLTGKRGIFFCGIATLIIVLSLFYINKGQWHKAVGILLVIIAVVLLFIFLIAAFPDNPLFSRFVQFFGALLEGGVDDSGRGPLYSLAIQLWSDNKLFGIGWRQFNNMTVSTFGYSRTHDVNLDYLQFLCETGIIGTILILIPILITLRRTIIVCNYYRKSPDVTLETQYMAFSAAFIQIFILIYAFIENPFCDVMFFSIYIFSVIIINGCYKQIKR